MRIEKLTVENARMQGVERRRWYGERSPQHLRSLAELVDRALRHCSSGAGAVPSAVVLGAGACTELPLERLARSCDAVVLADVDVAGMRRGCLELPSPLQERISCIGLDITGGVSQALDSELHAQPWDELAEREALDAAARCLERCAVPDPPVLPELDAGGFAVVISSLVLTQLFSLPLLDLLDTLALYVPPAVDSRDTYPRFQEAAQGFRRRVALAHLALLERLLAPGGMGVFASDVTGYLIGRHGAGALPNAYGALPVLPTDVLSIPGDFEERFRIVGPPLCWQWLATAPGPSHPGRLYDVSGLVFGARA